MTRTLFLATVFVVFLFTGVDLRAADETPATSAWQAEHLLKRGIDVDVDSLLRFLRLQTPDASLSKQVEVLITELGSDRFLARQQASKELEQIGVAAEPYLRDALENRDREVVHRARHLLQRLNSPESQQRRESLTLAALQLLKQRASPKSAPVLIDLLGVLQQSHLRDHACEALWRSVRKEHLPTLRGMLDRGDHMPAAAAIVAVEIVAGEDALDELEPLLESSDETIRLAATRALVNHRTEACLKNLVRLTGSKDAEVRQKACHLLESITGHKFDVQLHEDAGQLEGQWRDWLKKNVDKARLKIPLGEERFELCRRLVFCELFDKDEPNIVQRYGRFRYVTDKGGKALVEGGRLRLDGDHPEGDQHLFIDAQKVLGQPDFPQQFAVKATLGGEAESSGGWHLGVAVGNVRFLFHPDYSGGAFRAERVDNHKYLVTNQNMGFTPIAGVMHQMSIRVDRRAERTVRFEIEVQDGEGTGRKFASTLELGLADVGDLNRIGLARSGRTGGDALFDSVKLEMDDTH